MWAQGAKVGSSEREKQAQSSSHTQEGSCPTSGPGSLDGSHFPPFWHWQGHLLEGSS